MIARISYMGSILLQLTILDSLRVNLLNKPLLKLLESSESILQEAHLHLELQSNFTLMKILYAAKTITGRFLGSQLSLDLLSWMASRLWGDQGNGKVARLCSYGLLIA